MANPVTPSEVATAGQFVKLTDNFIAALRGAALPKDPFQDVLEHQGEPLTAELLAVVRRRVDAVSNMIVRRVRVDRTRTSQAAIDATGREQHVDRKVVETMPVGEGEEVDVYTFKPGPEAYDKNGLMSCAEAERQLDLRGLKPDPRAVAAMNEADPSFADDRPHGTQWKDLDGNYCFAAFGRWDDDRRLVGVRRDGRGWVDDWSLSGVRK